MVLPFAFSPCRIAIVTFFCSAGLGFQADQALADSSDLCIEAARDAAMITNVPVSVLLAIAITETGRSRNGETLPWPWTVNVGGKGYWFESRSDAEKFAMESHDRSIESFDIGCFQINYRWHGQNFTSIEQMFDPLANASYAASYLKDLHEASGNWSTSAGSYHSQNEVHASAYRIRFDEALAGLTERDLERLLENGDVGVARPEDRSPQPRRNTYPLLQERGGTPTLGSLVFLTNES